MQYQLFNKKTDKLVAWIEAETGNQVVHNDYYIKTGEELSYTEDNIDMSQLKLKVKFFDKDLYAGDNSLKKIGEKSDWIDLRAKEDVVLKEGESCCIPLGVAIQLPDGYEALLVPRSSTYSKWGIIQTNHIGIIDESYCGDNDEWAMSVRADRDTIIRKGDRVCQFRIIEHQPNFEIEIVDTLNNADRGGFGSTGTN